MKKIAFITLAFLTTTFGVNAQYNSCAGKSQVTESVQEEVIDRETGDKKFITVERAVKNKDGHGNVKGSQYDLAIDGAFEGQTIVVLNLVNVSLSLPQAALKEKGFSMYQFQRAAPSPKELEEALSKACQLWVISDTEQKLNDEHAEVIKRFFHNGKGVYLWGDNDPYHADVDFLAGKLVGVSLSGVYHGAQNVGFKTDSTKSGMRADHLITTGLEFVYEGITISKINDPQQAMTPLIWSTDGEVVAGIYEDQGQRLIIDGGFTRLYHNWDGAGTGRYVKNAAAWLVNYERFGEAVVSEK